MDAVTADCRNVGLVEATAEHVIEIRHLAQDKVEDAPKVFGRFKGSLVWAGNLLPFPFGPDDDHEPEIYSTEDGRVIAYWPNTRRHDVITEASWAGTLSDPSLFKNPLSQGAYVAVMLALGESPTIDI